MKGTVITGLMILVITMLTACSSSESNPATESNIAHQAMVTVSSEYSSNYKATNAVDGIKIVHDRGEWASRGQLKGAWILLQWSNTHDVSRIMLYDRKNTTDFIQAARLTFSDGSAIDTGALNNDGQPKEFVFAPKSIEWVRLEVLQAAGLNIGISEIEVFGF